ncbi:MAG: hypothetical protein CEN90_573 [Parcubacteria group bacterium Licking1014_17]|nr:MAG: hypothetical protein CEN90_573 [Parcubacteria group bacterium Licking1014_17]
MSPIIAVLLIFILLAIAIAALVVFQGFRSKGQVQRALNMTLLQIRVPREIPKDGQHKQDKELLGIAEQLFSSFSNLKSKGWNRLIFGDPYLALEISVHNVGEEMLFYVSVPRKSADVIEKQIYSYYPSAEIIQAKDYNIFNQTGAVGGGFLSYEKEAILPFRTYEKLEADPLSGILTSMSKLSMEGEGAAFQVIIRAARNKKLISRANKVAREMQAGYKYDEATQRASNPPKPKKPEPNKPPEPEKPRVITPTDDEIIKALVAKSGKVNFEVNVRFLVSALDPNRVKQILSDFQGSINQYFSPGMNSLKFVTLESGSLNKLIYDFSFRLFNEKQKLTLSTEELVSLYHFPLATTTAPSVKFLKAKPTEPPPNLPATGIMVGVNEFRGQQREIRLTDEDRRRHLYILGQTGTGKTTIMKLMLRQDVQEGKGVCVIDPHGEFADYVLSITPKERAEDIIYFNPGELDFPLGLNIFEFDPNHPEQKTLVINELFVIIDKLYNLKEIGGPMFEKYFKNACLLIMDYYEYMYKFKLQLDKEGRGGELSWEDVEKSMPILADISRVMVNEEYRNRLLAVEINPMVKQFWEMEATKTTGEQSLANFAPYITNKVDTFVSNDYLRPIINQQKSAINFREVMDQGKILVVNLSKGRIGDINAYLLGLIIVGKLLIAALSRVDIADERSRKDFYLYIDEFQNFVTDSISTILSEARKYRLDLIIGHQFIKQLPEKVRDSIFGNVGSMIVFRVSGEDADSVPLKARFSPAVGPEDLANIENLNAYASLIINGEPARPFKIRIDIQKNGPEENAKSIRELSKLKYGKPREQVEEDIRSHFSQ